MRPALVMQSDADDLWLLWVMLRGDNFCDIGI